MREIKFRYWDTKNKKFDTDIGVYLIGGIDLTNTIPEGYEITQFTGLTDRQGVDIYEGDLVRYNTGEMWSVNWSGRFAGFIYKNKFNKNLSSYEQNPGMHEVEVIGNIYETPNLLERTTNV